MRFIQNYELRVRRIDFDEQMAPYGFTVCQPKDVAEIAMKLFGDMAQEVFCVFILDIKCRIIGYSEVGRGSIDACPLDPRALFRMAIAVGGDAIIAVHNHPSQDLAPSKADIELTSRLKDCAEILGIDFMDHVIVSLNGYTSLKQLGKL